MNSIIHQWLKENALRCRERAEEAINSTQSPLGDWGKTVYAMAAVHSQAAELYERAERELCPECNTPLTRAGETVTSPGVTVQLPPWVCGACGWGGELPPGRL